MKIAIKASENRTAIAWCANRQQPLITAQKIIAFIKNFTPGNNKG
jgi:hypothetical protein